MAVRCWVGLLLLLQTGRILPVSSQATEAGVKTTPSKTQSFEGVFPVPATHVVTGVAVQQQQLQLDGRGVTIAIMDTGINYRHPVFGPCQKLGQGSRCRVTGGFDFLGNTEPEDLVSGLASAVPDPDPVSALCP